MNRLSRKTREVPPSLPSKNAERLPSLQLKDSCRSVLTGAVFLAEDEPGFSGTSWWSVGD